MPDNASVNQAFTAQSVHYDANDRSNRVLTDLRKQVYDHVAKYMQSKSHVLELNAGTGIDASYFVSKGHEVLTTDLSDGMIAELKKKGLKAKQLSYEQLDKLTGMQFDYVFSNFGGLNCIDDLRKVTQHLAPLLRSQSYVTWVIMPKVSPWELATIFKGNRNAFRRLKKHGVTAYLEGHHFKTWYHSLKDIKLAFGDKFEFIESEGLAALSPPPYKTDFRAYGFLRKLDRVVRRIFPFNRWADHIIVTFRYK